MAKIKTANNEIRKFDIHIPVFISERKEISGDMFEFNYNTLLETAEQKIKTHNKSQISITTNKRSKTIKRIIENIILTKGKFGKIPYLLLQVSAYNSNIEGQIIKQNDILEIEQTDKIGSNKNFILLYPQITVLKEKKYCNWIILVYDDPNKNSDDNIANAKIVMNSILDTPIKNIKLKKFIEELKQADLRPVIDLTLTSINFNEDEIDDEFLAFKINSKSISKKEFVFANMPIQNIENLINERFEQKFIHKVLKFKIGKREYKINQNLEKFKQDHNSTVETHFNFAQEIDEAQIKNLYEPKFMTGLMEKVLTEYLLNGENGLQ
ncbi:MAG: hypothetical protein MH132_03760 [Hydrotalea sp.]|nr:hypothetical protein [Hydrotalea sp.]